MKLTEGDTGSRVGPAMVYLAETREYVLVGGGVHDTVTPRPYDVQSLVLADPQWKNRFPQGKDWGPEVGPANPPGFSRLPPIFEDVEGNVRPNWGAWKMATYDQHAFNPVSNELLMYIHNATFAYNVKDRVWTVSNPEIDPALGPDHARLLWGSMAFDAVDNKVLLFGGGNVENHRGEPGTWIFEMGSQRWRRVEGPEPGPRAVAPLSTDPDRRQALLFGGDELDHLKSDTWIFDFETEAWRELTPTTVPAPRAGHRLLFLPTTRATVLLGGFEYASSEAEVTPGLKSKPMEIWRFDWSTPTWDLVHRVDEKAPQPQPRPGWNVAYGAAAGLGDVAVLNFKNGYAVEDHSETWAIRIVPQISDGGAGTREHGVAAGTEQWRVGPYDPAWYTENVPAPDPAAFAAELDAIDDNTWTEIEIPNRSNINHDWGTAALDPVRQRIFRWSGGHSAHSGTDVLEYDMITNRYSLSYPPEIPLEFTGSNDQVPGHWSFDNNPWMSGHSYKTYAYSTAVNRMVLYKRPYTYYYDPEAHDWELNPVATDMGGSMYHNLLCPVSEGMMAWTPMGIWSLNIDAQTWTQMPISGVAPPSIASDRTAIVADESRNRLLLFSSVTDHGQVYAYDRATGVLSTLDPQGRAAIAANASTRVREVVYVPSADLVVLGTPYNEGGIGRTAVYDPSENRWYAYDFDPLGLQGDFYDVSLGLMIDGQERIWAINTRSRLFMLKVEATSANRTPL